MAPGWSQDDLAGSIPQRFQLLAHRQPDVPAILDGALSLSYQELGHLVDQYAAALPGADEAGARAAVLLDHGAAVMAGTLAALRSGFTAVVLNPRDPPARHEQIRAAAEPAVLITDVERLDHAGRAGFEERETIVFSDEAVPDQERSYPGPDELAFLISTSGTTGAPKLAMQTHRNMLHAAMRNGHALDIVPGDRIAWLAPLSGSHGLSTAWMALLGGATLCPFPLASQGLVGLRDRLVTGGVTVFDASPSVLRNFSRTLGEERIPGIRLVRLTSEPALRGDLERVRRHFPAECVLALTLGSSETGTIAVARYSHDDEPAGETLGLGSEPEGLQVILADADGQPVADDGVGEVVVVGRYLSPGYWRDDELTAERFQGTGETRRFLTHDVGRRSGSDGLTLLGRIDSQIKIRGNRLQPEEVEGALAAQPGVAGAAVAVRASSRGDLTLTAYVMPASGRELDLDQVRRSLAAVLPAHAVPTTWVRVDALPVTPNGKVDRVRLAELEAHPVAPLPSREPVGGVEAALVSIWEELLDHRPIRLEDDFFSIGGDSLAAMEMLAAIEDEFGCSLTPADLLEAPTVRELAHVISGSVVATQAGLAVGARPALFLVPGIGQFGLRFRPLAQALEPDFPVRTLEVPWWNGRPSSIRTAERLAAFHIKQIREHQPGGPYLIGGSSFGGRVALEIARQLSGAGEEIALLVAFDTYIGINPEWNASWLRLIGARALWRLRQRGFGAVPQADRVAYVGHRTAELIRASRPAPYDGPVVLFRCLGSPSPEADRGWGRIARGGLEIHDLACRHDEQFTEPYVEEFASKLGDVLGAAYGGVLA